jgi:DNA-binding transcriptional regulator YdaS (Cro superfamily)
MTGAELLQRWIEQQRATPPAPGARFSLVQLAKDLGVSKTAVHAWRAGLQKPSDEHAEALERLTKNAVPAVAWRTETT